MTHVPFLLLSLIALRCFDIGIRREDMRWVAAASLTVVAAFFLRQTGIALAIPPLFVLWWRRRSVAQPGRLAAIASVPIVLFAVLFGGTDLLAGYPGQILEHFKVWQVPAGELPERALRVVTYYSFFNAQNAGLFLLPLTLAFLVSPGRNGRVGKLAALALAIVGAALGLHMINRGFPMPYWSLFARFDVHPGNVFVNLGLGPQTLPDVWVWNLPPPFPLAVEWSYLLTVVSGALGGVVVWALVLAWSRAAELAEKQRMAAGLALVHSVVATAALFVSGIYFDRYCVDSLWMLALLLPVLTDWSRERAKWAAVMAIAVTMTFSILGTQEYLRWNRARWLALNDLRGSGVKLEQLDGGYEVNQYLIGGFDGPVRLKKYGFSVVDNEYVIAFNRVPGYRVVARHDFESFLGLRKGAVLTLRRDPRRARDP